MTPGGWGWLVLAFPLLGTIAILGTGLKSLDSEGPTVPLGFGSPNSIGRLMLERFLVVFEATSMLLLVAAVGAIVLAARKRTADA